MAQTAERANSRRHGAGPVTDELIAEMVETLVSEVNSERIILFGFPGRGDAPDDSDRGVSFASSLFRTSHLLLFAMARLSHDIYRRIGPRVHRIASARPRTGTSGSRLTHDGRLNDERTMCTTM